MVVDMRSDTITKPTEGMKKAMMDALLGDDVYREDPTVAGISSLNIVSFILRTQTHSLTLSVLDPLHTCSCISQICVL